MANGIVKTNVGMISMLNSEYLGTTNVPTAGVTGTGTDTPDPSDTALQTQIISSPLTSGFPAVDTTALKATERWKLGTTDANGNNLSEIGVKDAAGNLKDRAVVEAIPKTNTDIVDFVIINKLRNKE